MKNKGKWFGLLFLLTLLVWLFFYETTPKFPLNHRETVVAATMVGLFLLAGGYLRVRFKRGRQP